MARMSAPPFRFGNGMTDESISRETNANEYTSLGVEWSRPSRTSGAMYRILAISSGVDQVLSKSSSCKKVE